jgi:hypothetical protein
MEIIRYVVGGILFVVKRKQLSRLAELRSTDNLLIKETEIEQGDAAISLLACKQGLRSLPLSLSLFLSLSLKAERYCLEKLLIFFYDILS